MTRSVRAPLALLGVVTFSLSLSGCGAPAAAPAASASPSASGSARPSPDRSPVAPGYAVGDLPPVPLFRLPDLGLLDSASASGFAVELRSRFAGTPGVSVRTAPCEPGTTVSAGQGSAQLYGDGSGTYVGADGTSSNFGDGSGSFTLNGVTVSNYGDGSGSYSADGITIDNYGDGSGRYDDGVVDVQIHGDGSGSYRGPDGEIQNHGDGSGSFVHGGVSITNNGDGSGSYSDGTLEIANHGDGTGAVNGEPVDVEPLAPVPRLGVFPPLAALQPLAGCGTVLALDAAVLFDFDRSAIRPDAAETLRALALALGDAPSAVVSGHTDSIGSDDYNLTLSERRAHSVVDALAELGVTADLTAEGHGESRPVAANEIEGQDNPAGRQLNRRVEVLIPAAP